MDIDNSTLSLYQTCLRQGYYYKQVKREPATEKPALVFGSCVHKGIEILCKTGDLAAAKQAAKDTWVGPVLDYRSGESAAALIEVFHKENPTIPWRFVEVDGAPWIERSFRVPIADGIDYTGRLDSVVQAPSGGWGPLDLKTTSRAGDYWWSQWDNAQQFLGYAWSLWQITGRMPTAYSVCGFAVRKPTATGTAMEYLGTRTWPIQSWQIEEWHANTLKWLDKIVAVKDEETATMNRSQCIGKWGPCQYKGVCDLAPQFRRQYLATDVFRDQTWDPTK